MRHLARCVVFVWIGVAVAGQALANCNNMNVLAPGNNAVAARNQANTVVLSWSEQVAAGSYDIYFGPIGAGCTAPAPHGTVQAPTTEWSPPANEITPGGQYEWMVAARDGGVSGCAPPPNTGCNTFTVASCPNAPTLQSPANNSTVAFGTIQLEWSVVPGATSYDIYIGVDGDALSPIGSTTQHTKQFQFEPGRSVEWKVVANAPSCAGAASAHFIFNTTCPTNPPSPLQPARNATFAASESIQFSWTSVLGAVSYDVQVSNDGGESWNVIAENLPNNSYSTALAAGNYLWAVRVNYDSSCEPLYSEPRELNVQGGGGGNCPANPGKSTLIAPANGATNLTSPVTFTWSIPANATSVRFLASLPGRAPVSSTIPVLNHDPDVTMSVSLDVQAGSGSWAVQTFFGDECPTTITEPRTFTVTTGATCNGAAAQLLSPANAATGVGSPVTFQWSSVSASRYSLFVASGDDDFSFYGETTGTSLARLVPAGVVKWYVIAHFTACPDARSSTSAFVARGSGEGCATATITLTAPANNATTGSPVHVAWTAVPNATSYRVWVAVDGHAPVNILRTNTTEGDIRLPAGAMTWYVDATRQNCDAVVSPQGRFTVALGANCAGNAAPALIAPVGTLANPAGVNSPVSLSWSAVANAIGYRIWISSNLRSFEDVTLTKETHVELELDPKVYAWYAEAFFDACPPVPSATAYFRVNETTARCPTVKPSLLSPSPGQVTTSPITFSWAAVDGAEKYRLFVSLDGSEPQLIGTTDETQLTRSLPPGAAIARVEAVFKTCPSTFSDRVNFTVQQAQNCGTTGAQLLAPSDGATNLESPIDFSWSPVNGAVKYILFAQVNDGAPTAIAATSDTSVTHVMPAGTIRWFVVTFFSGCDPVESAHFRFSIAREQNCDNRKPILLLPSDDRRALPSPVHFEWTAVPRATGYRVWARQGDADDPNIIASTTEANADVELPQGRYEYFVEARFATCEPTRSALGEFVVTAPIPCGRPLKPEAQVVGQSLSNTTYRLRWTPLPNVQFYEVQESTSLDFVNATTLTTGIPVTPFIHEVTGTPVQYLYRVRGVSDCGNGDRGPYSEVVGVFVVAAKTNNASTEIGSGDNVVQKVFIPGAATAVQFTATVDKPWLTLTPSSGTLPVEGLTLTVTADPAFLNLGTNTGTIKIEYGGASGKGAQTDAGTTFKIPLSVSLVTPVIPSGKGTPPPDALIFPVVGHATGANDSLFESDIRVTNLTAETARYELNFTPSNTDGTQTGSSSTIEIAPNATMALDDIVSSLFGTGTTSSAIGMLEVRPLTTTSSAGSDVGFFGSTGVASTIRALATAASSRTYNFTPTGTFGQYIPAIRFADFVGKAATGATPILSLQQVAESSAFRANFGFAEASGLPADLKVRVYDTASTLLKTMDLSLKAGEHQQLNGMLAANGVTNLADGRVEVEVVNGDGKVTAYVSEVDNKTNDPLLVSAVLKGGVTSNKWVVPGVAYINNPTAFWITDMRVFNAGTAATPATLTFYSESEPSRSMSEQITLQPGEIKVLDNVVAEHFAAVGRPTGSIAVTTPADSTLTVTARTYNKTANGTYGQFVPGVTPAESVGAEDRALQILQLEQSPRLRTNIGLLETAGQPVTIEVSAVIPDSLVTPFITYTLQPNEFRQISLGDFAAGQALYNTRVTVKVIGGTGRVTAYGSAIDELKGDPTYVPAQ
jgi:hypothetical protein